METTAFVIESDLVCILVITPQAQETICTVIAIGFAKPGASEPPCGAIRCMPRLLFVVAGVHGIVGASTTAVLRSCYVNDPVRCFQGASRSEEGLPIGATPRREDLRASRATVFLLGATYINTLHTLDNCSSRIRSAERHPVTLARLWTARAGDQRDFLHAAASIRLLAFSQYWKRLKLKPFVSTCGRVVWWGSAFKDLGNLS
jgi:hypothetical protein